MLIGANGSGKSNLIRFFEMMNWMLRARRLAQFITLQGGADDQLFRGSSVSPRMEATLIMRTDAGRNEYRFALAHAQPDRFMFVDEAFRFSSDTIDTEREREWFLLGSGHTEAEILDSAQSDGPGSQTARVIEVYVKWLDGLRDARARARVLVRVERLAAGNPGDVRPVGEGVSELRIDYGPGYRVYFKKQGRMIVVLLAGGDKRTQSDDIETALRLARNL